MEKNEVNFMVRKKKNKTLNIWEYTIAISILICISIYGYINQSATNKSSIENYNVNSQDITFLNIRQVLTLKLIIMFRILLKKI